MRIVFMPMLPLTQRDYEFLGIKYFRENGYDVSVLETHQLLLPEYENEVQLNYFSFENYIKPNSINELLKFIKNLSSVDFIFFYLASKDGVKLLNQIKNSSNVKFITYVSGSIPGTSSPCGIKNIVKRKLMPYIRGIQYFLGIGTFQTDYYFTGAPKDELIYPYLKTHKTKHIKLHSRDYERCLNIEAYKSEQPYCLFLDTDVVNASDYELFGIKINENDSKNYHIKLIKYFKWIENRFNLKVIISAHPKSRVYKDLNDYFGFRVVHDKSPELVKGCEFVINEGTTAVSFPIYFGKSIVFFTMNEISFFYNYACSYTKALKKSMLKVDTLNEDLFEQMKLELQNKIGYEYYKYNYLTYKDTDLCNFELINNELISGR